MEISTILPPEIKRPLQRLPLMRWVKQKRQQRQLTAWQNQGQPVPPPPIVKQQRLRELAAQFKLKILVETGTYYGNMIEAMAEDFEQIYSIELSEYFYQRAKRQFRPATHIKIIYGDSGIELAKLLPQLKQPALFWLDAHFSSGRTARGTQDTPVWEELRHVLNDGGKLHVIAIDDARFFGRDPAYPSLVALRQFVKLKWPNATFAVKHDMICITPG